MVRDAHGRYALPVAGVMRFAWEDVMFHPDYVRDCLAAAADLSRQQADRPGTTGPAA